MVLTPELQRIADSYPPEAAGVPVWERARHLTDTQHLAWMLRFDPERAAEVMSANHWPSMAEIWPDVVQASGNHHQGHHYG